MKHNHYDVGFDKMACEFAIEVLRDNPDDDINTCAMYIGIPPSTLLGWLNKYSSSGDIDTKGVTIYRHYRGSKYFISDADKKVTMLKNENKKLADENEELLREIRKFRSENYNLKKTVREMNIDDKNRGPSKQEIIDTNAKLCNEIVRLTSENEELRYQNSDIIEQLVEERKKLYLQIDNLKTAVKNQQRRIQTLFKGNQGGYIE